MKLAAIYNVWDGVELLRGSMNCLRGHVHIFIIVYQNTSNFGEWYEPLKHVDLSDFENVEYVKYVPGTLGGINNEKSKRNAGLEIARKLNCTHFLHLDCDEYYEDFGKAKAEYVASGAAGSVCKMWTYFKKPTYRLHEPEGYYVPFIHALKPNTTAGVKPYPFHCDPTRCINEPDVKLLAETMMHHFSYVRKDIQMKVRNSTARANIARGTLMRDYVSMRLGAGFYLKDFDRRIVEVENLFNISV